MAMWKHLIILFGGFYDPGITSMSSQSRITPPLTMAINSAIPERLMGFRHTGIYMDPGRVWIDRITAFVSPPAFDI